MDAERVSWFHELSVLSESQISSWPGDLQLGAMWLGDSGLFWTKYTWERRKQDLYLLNTSCG